MSSEHYAIGLNKKGFTYFVLLFIVFFPICWMPWLSKELRATPTEEDKKNQGMGTKFLHCMIAMAFMSCVLGITMLIMGKDPGEFGRQMDTMNAKIDVEMEAKDDYRSGYKAGYAYTNPSGKILTEKDPNFEGRLEQMNKSMANADNGVRSLENDYGGNKSQAWKDGCKEGYLDGLRNARAKH